MNWNKDTLIGVGVLVVIGALVIWYAAVHPAPVQAPGGAGAATTTPANSLSIEEHEQYYDIAAVYPASTPLASLGESADVNAVALMKQWEMDTIASFKTESGLLSLTPEDIKLQNLGVDGRKYALGITYQGAVSPRTVTYVFQVYADTLGAHPNGYYHTFTFDTQTGINLGLRNLFVAGAPYLQRLSDITRADMPAVIAAAENVSVSEISTDMLMDGTAPTEDNFANFGLDGADLVIIFQPYQIGPWALGTQIDRIPLSKLADILKPEYRPAS